MFKAANVRIIIQTNSCLLLQSNKLIAKENQSWIPRRWNVILGEFLVLNAHLIYGVECRSSFTFEEFDQTNSCHHLLSGRFSKMYVSIIFKDNTYFLPNVVEVLGKVDNSHIESEMNTVLTLKLKIVKTLACFNIYPKRKKTPQIIE